MNRRYDFDWLKIFGAVMVVIAHCAGSFSPWISTTENLQAYPEFSTVQPSKIFSELLWNLNLWLMPMFMLLAGASVWYTLSKRSNRQYLHERLLHLGLPLFILMFALVIPSAYWMRSSMGQFSGSLLDFYLHFFDGIAPTGNFTMFHMWFLVYLLIYVLLTLPLFRFLQSNVGQALIDKLARACQRPGGIYLFVLPLLIVQLALSGIFPTPEFPALVNDGPRFIWLLLVFIFGYILISDARFQSAIAKQGRLALVVTLATSVVMFAIAWQDNFNPYRDLPVDYSWTYVGFWTLFTICSWSWLIVLFGFGQQFLNVNHGLLKYASAISYSLYLLHPLIWIPSMFLVLRWQVNTFVVFFAQTVLVLAGTLALTAVLQRWSVTRFLLGLKTTTAPSQSMVLHKGGEENWSHGISAIAE